MLCHSLRHFFDTASLRAGFLFEVNMRQQYAEQNGVVNGINFDGRFSVRGYRGIAFFLLGYVLESEYTDDGDIDESWDTDRVVAVMVGDDRRHIIDVSDLTEIAENDYCSVCGQIGCCHDGKARSEKAGVR